MGADIHMYVEYRNRKRAQEEQKTGRPSNWFSYGGQTNPGRNYTLFGILAEVRGHYPDSFEPKGKLDPDEMSWSARSDARLWITDQPYEEGCCTLEQAQRWAERGLRIWHDEHGKPTWVEHPDWHSHSWMTIEELEEAFSRYQVHATQEWGEPITGAPLEYRALLAAMRELEDGGENEVRVIFWFDN